jgi:hypothetical protein
MPSTKEKNAKYRQDNKEKIKEREKENSRNYRNRNKNDENWKLKKSLKNRLYYQQKKQQNEKIQISEGTGYTKRDTMLKKVREVKKILPKDQKKSSQVVNELSKQYPYRDENLKPRPKALSNDDVLAQEFYSRDNVSVCLPGKKDCLVKKNENGEKVLIRKRVLADSKDEIFKKFKAEFPDLKIGRTKFFSLNPQNVLSFKKMPSYSCQCKMHENFRLAFNVSKKFISVESVISVDSFTEAMVCDTKNYDCMTNQCDSCKNVLEKIKDLIVIVLRGEICFKQWDLVNKKYQLKEIKLQPKSFLKKIAEQFIEFKKHSFLARVQSQKLLKDISTFDPSVVKIIFDFSENFTIKPLNEIQAAFYTRSQVTLYTAVAYIPIEHEDAQEIRTACFGIVSDSMQHNKYSVFTFNSKLFGCILSNYTGIEKMELYSDGAPSQYKNSFSLSTLPLLEKNHACKFAWNFAASSHGKSPADGVGGSIKSMVERRMLSQDIFLQTAKDFADLATTVCEKFNILYIPQTEINDHKKMLDNYWMGLKAIENSRSFHRFEAVNTKFLKCSVTSLNHAEREIKIFR